jgi:hypothetical protein
MLCQKRIRNWLDSLFPDCRFAYLGLSPSISPISDLRPLASPR